MGIQNEELMQKFVRTGMIMRHIDGEGPGGHGKGKCHHAHGRGARFEMGEGAEHPHGPHGHGPHGAPEGHEEGHGHGCEEGRGHGHGHGHHKGHRHGQMRAIAMIAMKEGINQKDLAFLLGIRPQTMGEILRKLEDRGLVERKKSEADGRAIEVYLTDEGRARADEIAERRKLAAADMFSVLTDEEKEQLIALLDKLAAANFRNLAGIQPPRKKQV